MNSPLTTPSIAIVGSGPSGCYLAQALRKQWPESPIDLFERLPVPFGLVRYGVAPDHTGTKAIARQFERLFTRDGVRFFGNIGIGRDLSLEQLREAYDIVVLATGLYGDRALGIEGETLAGIYRAGPLTRMLNGHPDEQQAEYDLGERCVIVGNGNVALDLLRLLSKPEAQFTGSELAPQALQRLQRERLKRIDIVGRSPLAAAKFDTVMLRELGEMQDVRFVVDTPLAGEQADEAQGPREQVLQALQAGSPSAEARLEIHFHFGWTPAALYGEGRVNAIEFDASAGSGERLRLEADSVLTAIGFAPHPQRDLCRDDLSAATADLERGRLDRGLYCTGWFKRGPIGTIPENRLDSRRVAATIIDDYEDYVSQYPGAAALPPQLLQQAVDYAGWQRIDRAELDAASDGRIRRKFTDLSTMLTIARQGAMGEECR